VSGEALALGRGDRRAPAWGGWVLAAVGVLVAFLVADYLAGAVAPAPSGPASSSYATTPKGVAAWAELLARAGHPVGQLRQDLGQASLDPGSTLVVLGASSLTPAAASNMVRFVRSGGVLVLGTAAPGRVIADPPVLVPTSAHVFEPASAALRAGGVASVHSAGAGAWRGGAGKRVLVDRAGSALLVARPLGRGEVELLADPSPVQNRLLGSADNALFAVELAGARGRPVLFAEALHGFGPATGIAAIPSRFWFVFAGLCLAAAAFALARGRRLGPPEEPGRIGYPPRSAYVDALAGALTRGRDVRGLTRVLRARIEAELEGRAARRAMGAEVPRREALVALGVSSEEADLVLAPER
jgi:hypothetical protein